MRIEPVLFTGGITIGISLGAALSALKDHQWSWVFISLAIAMVVALFLLRFLRRNT